MQSIQYGNIPALSRSGPPGLIGRLGVIGCLLAAACAIPIRAADAPKVAAPPQVAVARVEIKSEFTDNPKFGKDPFFPRSERRAAAQDTNPGPETLVNVGNLVLKGISGPANHRLAIINNRTFAPGETAELKNGTQVVTIRCMEVRDKSVVVKINGVTRELFMTQKFSSP